MNNHLRNHPGKSDEEIAREIQTTQTQSRTVSDERKARLAEIKSRFALDVDLEDALKTLDPELWSTLVKQDAEILMLSGGINRPDGSCNLVTFRTQDAESLLDQASAIIDRALADRNTWKSLLERWATLRIDLIQSACLELISEAEERNSRFDYEADLAEGQKNARERKTAALADQQTKVTSLRNNLDTNTDTAKSEVIRRAAMAYGRDMYNARFIDQAVTTDIPPQRAHLNPEFGTPDPVLIHQSPGDDGRLKGANYKMARDQAKAELDRQFMGVDAESQAVKAQTEELDANKKGLDTQFAWANANRIFLRQRAWAARQALLMKLAMASHGDALDYIEQSESVKSRYIQAISDAYCRLETVENGLKAYYGYPHPDTNPDPLPKLKVDDTKSHDEIVAWLRRVAHWMAAFSKRTNSYIAPLSLKILTDNAWVQGQSSGSWTFSLENYFDTFQRHVRVRGVTAWAVNDRNALWQVDLTPPKSATVHLESGELKSITQDAPLCRISRVMSRVRLAVPEVGAVTAAFTGSPIGQWKVTVRNAATPKTVPEILPEDIEIDLYLSFLYVPDAEPQASPSPARLSGKN